MPASIKCPYCNTAIFTTINSQTTCPKCKAILHIDNNGYCSHSTLHLLQSTKESDSRVQKSHCRRQF